MSSVLLTESDLLAVARFGSEEYLAEDAEFLTEEEQNFADNVVLQYLEENFYFDDEDELYEALNKIDDETYYEILDEMLESE